MKIQVEGIGEIEVPDGADSGQINGIISSIQSQQAAPKDDYEIDPSSMGGFEPEAPVSAEAQAYRDASMGGAKAEMADGGFSLDQDDRKSAALQAEPAWKRAAATYGGSIYDTGRGLQQIAGMDLSPEQEEEVRAQRELWKHGGAAGKAGKIAGEVAQLIAPGAALEKGALKLASKLPRALNMVRLPARMAATGAVEGGLSGAIQPTLEGEDRGENIAAGATGGALAGGALGVAGKALKVAAKPFHPTLAAARQMVKGKQPTLGQGAAWQIKGWKPLQKLENSLRLLTGRGQQRFRQEIAEDMLNQVDQFDTQLLKGGARNPKRLTEVWTQLRASNRKAYKAIDSLVERSPTGNQVSAPLTYRWAKYGKKHGIPDAKIKGLMSEVKEKMKEMYKGREPTATTKVDFGDYREFREWMTDRIVKLKGPAANDIDQRHIREMLIDMKSAMTDNVGKHYGPRAAGALKRVDAKYHRYKLLEEAGVKKGGVTPESLDSAIKKWYDKGTYLEGEGAFQKELADINEAFPAPEGGAWGGMALMGAISHLIGGVASGGGSGVLSGLAILGATRTGAKTLLGGQKWQRGLSRSMNRAGKKYRGLPSAVAGAHYGGRTLLQEDE